MRRAATLVALGTLAASCGLQRAPETRRPSLDGGVRAIDSARAENDPDFALPGDTSTGRWGGVQVPNVQDAPGLLGR
jgi:hypothetical protein